MVIFNSYGKLPGVISVVVLVVVGVIVVGIGLIDGFSICLVWGAVLTQWTLSPFLPRLGRITSWWYTWTPKWIHTLKGFWGRLQNCMSMHLILLIVSMFGEYWYHSVLVGGLEHFLCLHILEIIIQSDWYFWNGMKPPTRWLVGRWRPAPGRALRMLCGFRRCRRCGGMLNHWHVKPE